MAISLSTPGISQYFVAAPNGAWHCPSTGATMGGAILAEYQSFGGKGLCGLTYWGLPKSPEIGGIPNAPGVVIQRFERVVACYVPDLTHNPIDWPPGLTSNVFLLHIDSGIGEDPRVTDLQGHVDALTAQVATLQAGPLALENVALKAKIAGAVKDLLKDLQ